MKCPNCGYFNMPGAAQCGQCQRSLSEPATPAKPQAIPLEEIYPPRARNRSTRAHIEARSPAARQVRRFARNDLERTRNDVFNWRLALRWWLLSLTSLVPGLGQCLQRRYTMAALLFSFAVLAISFTVLFIRHWVSDLLIIAALGISAYSVWDAANVSFPPAREGLMQRLRAWRLGFMSVASVMVLVLVALWGLNRWYGLWTVGTNVAAPVFLQGDGLIVRHIQSEVAPLKGLRRGDIIVCEPTDVYNIGLVIERILGLPGDVVEYSDGVFTVNGRRLSPQERPLSHQLGPVPFKVTVPVHNVVIWRMMMGNYEPAPGNDPMLAYYRISEDAIRGRVIGLYAPPYRRQWLRR